MKLTVLGMRDESNNIDASKAVPHNYWIVDDSRTGLWQVDERAVYVPFDILQKDLQMTAGPNPDDEPARVTDIEIGAKPGYDLYKLKPQIEQIVDDVMNKGGFLLEMDKIKVQTWEEQQADFLGAVEHEKVLVTFLFGIISLVAIFLIFCIFYMIVVEKTRDIGIISKASAQHRANTSPRQIFLAVRFGDRRRRRGAAGLLMGYLIVHNINQLHAWLTRALGIQIWSAVRRAYAFRHRGSPTTAES